MAGHPFSPRTVRLLAVAGALALAGGLLVLAAHLLWTGDVDALDRALIIAIADLRQPGLNVTMADLTSLGSGTLVTLFALVALAVLVWRRDLRGAAQLGVAVVGASGWVAVTKDLVARARPTEVAHLITVSGFSYPSGHSMRAAATLLTLALLVCRYLPGHRRRVLLLAGVLVVILLVGFSRSYLGVHYPTDVAGSMLLGLGWALVLAAGFARTGRGG